MGPPFNGARYQKFAVKAAWLELRNLICDILRTLSAGTDDPEAA